jgi:hypothetical protein
LLFRFAGLEPAVYVHEEIHVFKSMQEQ